MLFGIDIFSGPGGLSLGAEMAGIKISHAVEIDINAASTFLRNHKDAIIGVKKIGYQEYVDGIKQNEEDDYFHIHNSYI